MITLSPAVYRKLAAERAKEYLGRRYCLHPEFKSANHPRPLLQRWLAERIAK